MVNYRSKGRGVNRKVFPVKTEKLRANYVKEMDSAETRDELYRIRRRISHDSELSPDEKDFLVTQLDNIYEATPEYEGEEEE